MSRIYSEIGEGKMERMKKSKRESEGERRIKK